MVIPVYVGVVIMHIQGGVKPPGKGSTVCNQEHILYLISIA